MAAQGDLRHIWQEASVLADYLCSKKFTFFLGAGFSKNIPSMPDFNKLVRNRILPHYYADLVEAKQTQPNQEQLLLKKEFRPRNCLHCFLESSYTMFPDSENWARNVTNYTVDGKKFIDFLIDFILQLRKELLSQYHHHLKIPQDDQRNKTLRSIRAMIIDRNNLDSDSFPHFTKCSNEKEVEMKLRKLKKSFTEWEMIRLRNWVQQIRFQNQHEDILTRCGPCMKAKWNNVPHKESYECYFLLGLMQSFLDQREYQIKDLLEYMYGQQGKLKIAQYIFLNNPNFQVFRDMFNGYHHQPQKMIGDSQIALARLAKEGFISEIITTNWDDLMEFACHAVGMYVKTSDGITFGHSGEEWQQGEDLAPMLEVKRYNNYAISISEEEDFYNSSNPPANAKFYLYKIHGSVDTILNHLGQTEEEFDVNLVITHSDLLNWRNDKWSEDLVNSVMRSHEVVFAGISGQDNVIYATVRKLIEEVKRVGYKKANRHKDQNVLKNFYSIAIDDELILGNMLKSAKHTVSSEILQIPPAVSYHERRGMDLFYRWFYVTFILKTFQRHQVSYVRKTITDLCNGVCNEELFASYLKKVETFLNTLLQPEPSYQDAWDLRFFFYGIFFDVVPHLITYTWLLNRDLSTIFERIGGTNFLFKKPHFYLPLFYYLEEFTQYIILFSEIYVFLQDTVRRYNYLYQHTRDGVVVIDGVAFVILLGGTEENWGNFEQFGVRRFSPETNVLLAHCRKKVVFHLDEKKKEYAHTPPALLHSFKYHFVTLEGFRKTLEVELRR